MILITHNNAKVLSVYNFETNQEVSFTTKASIVFVLKTVGSDYPESLLVWVNETYKDVLNTDELPRLFHHKRLLLSFSATNHYCIGARIGYVEKTPYTNIKRDVNFPTWLMSSDVGGLYAETFNAIVETIPESPNFDYFLSALAKQNMPQGLLCYSNPFLLKPGAVIKEASKDSSTYLLFQFVRQHYKWVWSLNLFACFLIFEKRCPILPFSRSLFFKRSLIKPNLNPLEFKSSLKGVENKTIDVIIPTIGRKESLLEVLNDLAKQTLLPKNVIIVEQNPERNSVTALDYLTNKNWPFHIIHKFIHQTGACNARNLALAELQSDWVFFADDDIRIDSYLIEKSFTCIESLGNNVALNLLCLKRTEKQSYFYTSQTDIFGSGTSIVKTSFLREIRFDNSFEFGFGEDSDFGIQLRNLGVDVVYIPTIKITHLKLPFGGFRTPIIHGWETETMQPKPSPTIMVFIKKHYNTFQKNGYKYVLFLKFYKKQSIKNPFKYLKHMQKQWKSSVYWSQELMRKNHA